MNYMKQVAQMLGVELEEEFFVSNTLICKFVNNGLLMKHNPTTTWYYDDTMLKGLLSGEYEIVKKPILDETEKEYLSAVIKPFRNKVTNVYKYECACASKAEAISINFYDDGFGSVQCIDLPSFKKDTMYKGMEVNKEYSLEDLGL